MRKKCFYSSPGPAETYAKCKQCLSLPLSLVTRANYCAVFIRVEMICANKERLPSSTLCCVFSSQNCKWMQPPHLVPAGSVPVPPISALLTAGIQQKTGSANSRRWCLINTSSPLTASPLIFYCLAGWPPTKVKMWRCLANRAAYAKKMAQFYLTQFGCSPSAL